MALDYAKVATDLIPQFRDSWRFRAGVHLSLGERQAAIECTERAVECSDSLPDDLEFLNELRDGQFRSVSLDPVSFGVRGLGDVNNPVGLGDEQLMLLRFELEQALKFEPDSQDLMYQVARCRYYLKEYPQARERLALLLDRNSCHVEGCVLRGLILQKQGEDSEAEQAYRKALEVEPSHYLANTNLAYLLIEKSKHVDARRYLEVAMKSNPDYAPTLSLYGNTVAALEQDYSTELDFQRRALALEPNNPRFILNFCTCSAQAGAIQAAQRMWKKCKSRVNGPDFEEQKKLLDWLLFPPNDVIACFGAVFKLIGRGLRGPVLSPLLKQLWSLRFNWKPEDFQESMHHCGLFAGQCKELALSLRFFEEAHRVSVEPGFSIFNVAVALGELGRYDEALEKIRTIGNFTMPRAYTISGNLKRDAGHPEEALEDYRKALQFDAEFGLLYSAGADLARILGKPEVLREFFEHLEANRIAIGPAVASIHPWCLLWLGYPRQAASGFLSTLGIGVDDCVENCLTENEADELCSVPSGEDLEEEDFTLFLNRTKEKEQYLLGISLLRGRQFKLAWSYAVHMKTRVAKGGDWTTIQAEVLRHTLQYQMSLNLLNGSKESPHQLSAALNLIALGQTSEAKCLLEALADGSGDDRKHPEGTLSAVAGVNLLKLDWQSGHLDVDQCLARLAEIAIATPGCMHTYHLIVEILMEQGNLLEANRWLEQGLCHRVGDPELLNRQLSLLITGGSYDQARVKLEESWTHFEEHGREDLAHLLRAELLSAELSRQRGISATPHSESTMENWFETLPFPLASILRAWQATPSDDFKSKYEHLLHFFEATAQFIGVIFLSAFSTEAKFFAEHRDSLQTTWEKQNLSLNRATFGTWKVAIEYFSKQTRKLLSGDSDLQRLCGDIFADTTLELPGILSTIQLGQILSKANKMRNDWTGHGGIVSPGEARLRNERLVSELESLRSAMGEGWSRLKLVSPLSCKPHHGVFDNELALLVGSNSEFLKESWTMATWLDVGRLYLAKREAGRALQLLPLIQVGPSPSSAKNACYFFNRVEKDGLRFVSYHYLDQPELREPFLEAIESIRFLTSGQT